MKSFHALKLTKEMLQNLDQMGYREMMPVQEASIPPILEGRDILAQAKTGSGKTAAFGIGILHRLRVKKFRIQALILCPTRELAEQVAAEIRRLGRYQHNIKTLCLTGGKPMHKQEHSLSHQAHIVVGTPGRIHRLLEKGSLSLEHLHTLVLDEADRMLDMGFLDQVKDILHFAPPNRQRLCFSATFPEEIEELARTLMDNPEHISVESQHSAVDLKQHFYHLEERDKGEVLAGLIAYYKPESALIFCNTKEACRRLSKQLNGLGVFCLSLEGDMEQKDRTETLIRFSNGSSPVLVATDVAARGLDIEDLSLVINGDLPFEVENYIHRIGRTGRAGKSGLALSVLKENHQYRLDEINREQQSDYRLEPLPFNEERIPPVEAPEMVTLSLNGGRRSKVSAGDILGALTAPGGISGKDVGKIDRLEDLSYVAVRREKGAKAMEMLQKNPIKGRKLRVMLSR